MDLFNNLNQSFLWASCIWGGIAMGYWAYGWKQRSFIPFLGGAAMMVASCMLPALTMSAVCIVVMFGVWWLLRQGY